MDFHVFGSGNSKHSTQGSEFSNRSKSLSVVQMRFLRETFGHKPSLIAIHRAIRLHLDAIHPAATNSFPTRGQFTQFPNSVLKKCIVLLLGSFMPEACIISTHRFLVCPWFHTRSKESVLDELRD